MELVLAILNSFARGSAWVLRKRKGTLTFRKRHSACGTPLHLVGSTLVVNEADRGRSRAGEEFQWASRIGGAHGPWYPVFHRGFSADGRDVARLAHCGR